MLNLPNTNLIKSNDGFTLIELVVVITLLGVMAVGITGFMSMTTQLYVNVSERDELIANARFVIERMNREVRNAAPNSIRIGNDAAGVQCLEFVPIIASADYIDIPIPPETGTNSINIIKPSNKNGASYQCNDCGDYAIVYPLSPNDIYFNLNQSPGSVFQIANISDINTDTSMLTWKESTVTFKEKSPSRRLYIAQQQVSYCVSEHQIKRYENNLGGVQQVPPANGVLMATNLASLSISGDVFNYTPATLQRNAIVQVNLHFSNNDEYIVFNNEIHISNAP